MEVPPLQLALSQSFFGYNLTENFKSEVCFASVTLQLFLEHLLEFIVA